MSTGQANICLGSAYAWGWIPQTRCRYKDPKKPGAGPTWEFRMQRLVQKKERGWVQQWVQQRSGVDVYYFQELFFNKRKKCTSLYKVNPLNKKMKHTTTIKTKTHSNNFCNKTKKRKISRKIRKKLLTKQKKTSKLIGKTTKKSIFKKIQNW